MFLLINHFVNFFLPAVLLAVIMACAARLGAGSEAARSKPIWREIKINVFVGSLVCLIGLLLLGQDGKMWTYAALVFAVALIQWRQGRRN